MSVLIKGMEMPTGCDDCEFCKRDISGYDWCCVPMINGRDKPLDEPVIKPDWCPLVPVPPHGRLIDAGELLEWANAGLRFGDPDFHAGLWHMVSAIDDAPTIIPAEEGE